MLRTCLTAVAKLSPAENEVVYFDLVPQILRKRFASINNETVKVKKSQMSSICV